MSDAPTSAPGADPVPERPVAGKRKGRRRRSRRSRTVLKALLTTVVVVAMVSGLSGAYLYRHLNGNLTGIDVSDQLTDRPDKVAVEGPQEPLNILVMGSDSRDCDGCAIDQHTDEGQRSDTTIFVHLSADRSRAYGVSIPRDSMVDRPDCKSEDGETIPGADYQMWNAAYSLGGPACTIQQFESLTGIRTDHFVVVNFESFRNMVDAVGGVEMCIPETIDDPDHQIFLEAGTYELDGQQALDYVRERYAVSGGSDIGRMRRQQAFIASMISEVFSAGTLTNPIRIVNFLEAATQSLTLDSDLASLVKLGDLGYQFRNIGLDKIQFLTIPNTVDPNDPNHLVWTDEADDVWDALKHDEPLSRRLSKDVITAKHGGTGGGGGKKQVGADDEELRAAGLCA